MTDVHWPRVKEILDGIMARWEEEHGRKPHMKGAHQADIGWNTKEQLASSAPYDKQLIEPDKVGNGRAHETNLVRILTSYIGGYRRMPSRGPYLSRAEIEEIAQWIDAGMPD
ncbi:MAG: cytochrome c [Thermodesulfobacteriota bacterium]